MNITYQDVLEAVCSEVALVNANDAQHIFSINTAREAKLAYDVLAAHGFDVHLYPEADLSKLYITHNANADDARLASALHYARTIKALLNAMHPEVDFHLAFSNTSTQGKQISIYFPPAAQEIQPSASRPAAAATVPAMPYQAPRKKVKYRAKEPDLLRAGPELGKKYPFGIPSAGDNPNQMTFSKWLSTHIFSNFAESFYAFAGMAFFLLVAISVWVMLKGYLCPDLAKVKSRAWYCVTD